MIKNEAKRLIASHVTPVHIALHVLVDIIDTVIGIERGRNQIFASLGLLRSVCTTPREQWDHGRCVGHFPGDGPDTKRIYIAVPELAVCSARSGCEGTCSRESLSVRWLDVESWSEGIGNTRRAQRWRSSIEIASYRHGDGFNRLLVSTSGK